MWYSRSVQPFSTEQFSLRDLLDLLILSQTINLLVSSHHLFILIWNYRWILFWEYSNLYQWCSKLLHLCLSRIVVDWYIDDIEGSTAYIKLCFCLCSPCAVISLIKASKFRLKQCRIQSNSLVVENWNNLNDLGES